MHYREHKEDYHGFTICDDDKMGYSLYDRKEGWCCSMDSPDKLKGQVDKILATDKPAPVKRKRLPKK